MRRSTFGLLVLDVGFRSGSGAHGRRRGVSVGAGGSDRVLQPILGIVKGLSVGPTKLDLGSKGGRSENGCDCERGSHFYVE